jgi:aminoglycoside phosphotransferase (APT) family kinase protein
MDVDSLKLPFTVRPTVDNASELSLDHWEKTMFEQQLEPQPFLTEGFRWLRANAPKASRVSLLHGDYRAGNFLFQGDRITAIVDWELASLGDPLQDLGWAVMNLWRLNDKICGFYELEDFLQRYESISGIPVDRQAMAWWEVWANMKLAVIGLTGTRTRVLNLADEINYSISHLYLPPLFSEMAKGMGI